jgi:hypothetical protein
MSRIPADPIATGRVAGLGTTTPRGPLLPSTGDAARRRLRRLFLEGFRALDVAEPLVSFDAERQSSAVRAAMLARGFDLAGVMVDGIVAGYVSLSDLESGRCGDHLRAFGPDDVVTDDASLRDVVLSLGVNDRCFVTVLDHAAAIVTLDDLEKPPMRMFLFGMVTILEMLIARLVESAFPGDTWTAHVAPGRLAKAREIMMERQRRGHACRLIDCLQFSDKGQVALRIGEVRQRLASDMSGKEAKRALKELEHLRNNLAHGQEIIPSSWGRIVRFSTRLDELLETI